MSVGECVVKRKIIAAILVLAALPSVIHAQSRFTDMKDYGWAIESVEALYDKGVIKGTSKTQFSPASEMKRGDFALMTERFFSLEPGYGENYSDVKDDAYYSEALLKIKTLGAYDSDNFEPERAITREEAIGLIYNVIYQKIGVREDQFSEDSAQYYSDANEIKWDKVNAVATLTKMGIIHGDEGKFFPKKTLTRAETAVIFFNLYGIKERELTPTPTPAMDEIKAVVKITDTKSEVGKQYLSTGDNESVIWVKDASYSGESVTYSKASGTSANKEKAGLNAALLSENSSVELKSASVLASADNSDAVFANDKSNVKVYNSALVATGDESSAVAAALGSEVSINNTRISSSGKNSASIKTFEDGTINGEGVYVMTSDKSTAAVHSMGKVVLNNSTISAPDAYMAEVEGNGEVSSFGSSYTGGSVILYQSNKDGKNEGMGKFAAYNSKISSTADALFYVTNTDAEINLTASEITLPAGGALVKAEAGKWGNDGANGGHACVNVQNQTAYGDVITDGISSVTLNLMGKSSYSGALNKINYTGAMNITLSSASTWTVTADSYVTAIEDEDKELTNIISNGHSIFYDPSAAANKWLDGKTIPLSGGGELKPVY